MLLRMPGYPNVLRLICIDFSGAKTCSSRPPVGRVDGIGALHAILNDIPELGHVHGARYAHAGLAARQQRAHGAARLNLAVPGVLKDAGSHDGDAKALIVPRGFAARSIPIVKGDFVGRAGEHGGDGEGIVQRGALCDAKDVAVSELSVRETKEIQSVGGCKAYAYVLEKK